MSDERPDMNEAVDEATNERERRVEAALALTSRAPASLWERIRARRAAGERVLLPVAGLQPTPRRRGMPALALTLAAAAVVTVFAVQAWRASPDDGAKRGPGLVTDPAAILYTTTIDGRGRLTIDSALAVAVAGEDRLVEIVYSPGSSPAVWAARRVADSIAAEFRGRGVSRAAVIVGEISEIEQARAPLSPGELRITVFRDGTARGRD